MSFGTMFTILFFWNFLIKYSAIINPKTLSPRNSYFWKGLSLFFFDFSRLS